MTLKLNSPQSHPTPFRQLGCGIPRALALSPDNNVLAAGCPTGIWLYNVSIGEPIAPAPLGGGSEAVTFSENGRWVATVNRVGAVDVFDMSSLACLTTLYPEEPYLGSWYYTESFFLCFSADNRWIASSGGGYIHIWALGFGGVDDVSGIDPPSGSEKQYRLPCHRRGPLAFSPNSCMLAYVEADEWVPGHDPLLPTYISVCNIAIGETLVRLESSTDPIRSLCFSPCGQFIAAGGADTVQVWEIASGSLQWRSRARCGLYKQLVTYSSDGTLYSAELSFSMCDVTVTHTKG